MRYILAIHLIILTVLTVSAGPHTLRRGESFADVARLYHLPVDSVVGANGWTEAYTGLTIDVPKTTCLYDMGASDLFYRLVSGYGVNDKRAGKAYAEAMSKLRKYSKGNVLNEPAKEAVVLALLEKAVDNGSCEALYQLGRFYIHGGFVGPTERPRLGRKINADVEMLEKGIEYLQIAVHAGGHRDALKEMIFLCLESDSPIYEPFIGVTLLEQLNREIGLDVDKELCEIYLNGESFGIPTNYIKAYRYSRSKLSSGSSEATEREKILSLVDRLPSNIASEKYGVNLDEEALLAYGMAHMHDSKIEPEGLFFIHRAARAGNADANWALACILGKDMCDDSGCRDKREEQAVAFADKAARLGNSDAADYMAEYREYQREKERYERQQLLAEHQRQEARRAQRAQFWSELASTVLQAGSMIFMKSQQQRQMRQMSQQSPRIGNMTAAQSNAYANRAFGQIAAYTYNKTFSDWTGVPMMPVDMSGVNLGSDMTPGSPMWMWVNQQEINRGDTQYARFMWERASSYARQTAMIEQQLMVDPLKPIAGVFDIDGNWITADMIATDMDNDSDSVHDHSSRSGGNAIVQKVRQYNQDRYGDRRCRSCQGSGECQTCHGRGYYYNGLTPLECPNCHIEGGRRTGLCGHCGGSGTVYGLLLP